MSDAPNKQTLRNPDIDTGDDMYDSPEDIQLAGALQGALKQWEKLADLYWDSNKEAMRKQSRYRKLVTWGVVGGCAAVILAILQLFFGGTHLLDSIFKSKAELASMIVVSLEALAALGACAIVIWGLSTKTHEHWLLERHRAERVRLQKYRSLIEFGLKGLSDSELPKWSAEQRRKIEVIEHLKEEGLQNWISENYTSYDEFEPKDDCISEGAAADLLEYFRKKRLSVQTNYFLKKSKEAEQKNWVTRRFPAVLLLASFAFAFFHFGLDLYVKIAATAVATAGSAQSAAEDCSAACNSLTGTTSAAFALIAFAACAPVLGSAIRTYRNAYEFARNSLRFLANFRELDFRSGKLSHAGQSTKEILKQLWKVEDTLEREHREWLRLMIEAEWYG
ncbi:MAG TPA: hypothetical protein VN025_01980 [Candidatus Dormibacteraeota bacterium]|jgi:hypothetical protein|nr:hypothetical protein [Candidatus Dormibacteraeota bacterium]